MRSFNYCRVLLLLVVFVFSPYSFSADPSWEFIYTKYNTLASGGVQYQTAALACKSEYPASGTWGTNAIMISSTKWECIWGCVDGWCNTGKIIFPHLNPDYVPPGPVECEQTWTGGEIVWSESQQQCVKYPNLQDAEACAYGAGQGWSKSVVVNSNDASGPGQYVDPASKCVADIDATTSDCASRVNSDGDGSYRCKVTGKYNGDYNPNGTNSPDGFCPTGDCTEAPDTPEVPSPTPSEFNDTQPCIYGSDGQGGLTCTSSTKNEKEGSSQCGTVNGTHTCISKAPQYNGIEIVSNVQSQTNPDGSTTTTKTDTATSTTCKNIGDCTTSSTTTTSTTTKNGAGETTSVSGSCTGAQCPDENTNPDGDGDGLGDCVGGECGEGEGGGADWYEPGEDTYQSVIEAYADRIADTPVLSGVSNFLTFTPSGACPVYTVDTWVFSIRLDQWCSGSTIPWELIQAVILAAAAFFAFRIAFL